MKTKQVLTALIALLVAIAWIWDRSRAPIVIAKEEDDKYTAIAVAYPNSWIPPLEFCTSWKIMIKLEEKNGNFVFRDTIDPSASGPHDEMIEIKKVDFGNWFFELKNSKYSVNPEMMKIEKKYFSNQASHTTSASARRVD